jgi:uncharacterized membrane protein
MTTPVRSARERLLQTLWFEGLGMVLITPAFSLITGTGSLESLSLLAALSIVVMGWAALFNTAFDCIEARWAARKASDRPRRWRVVHAAGLEISAVLVSCPLIIAMTGLGWRQALMADLGLTLAYVAYAYVFHFAFDRLRPVGAP